MTQFRWKPHVADEKALPEQNIKIQVIEYTAVPVEDALAGYFQPVVRPSRRRQLAIQSSESSTTILEPGLLQYLQGNIELSANKTTGGSGLGGLLRGAMTAAATGESLFKTFYKGAGMIYTEPTGHYLLVGDIHNDSLIVDDGAFVACAGNITIGRHVHRNLVNAMGSGEGLVQTKLSGTGLFALKSPVPPSEYQEIVLKDDVLKVDGNLAIAYSASLQFNVETSSRGLLNTAKTGEGFLQVFRGTGRVWLAPTLPLYFHHPASAD